MFNSPGWDSPSRQAEEPKSLTERGKGCKMNKIRLDGQKNSDQKNFESNAQYQIGPRIRTDDWTHERPERDDLP